MLTLQKGDSATIVSLSTTGRSLDDLLAKEWLLTNQRGSYASSTVIGCNTSGYHGLLIGSIKGPDERIMALANCLEMVIFNGATSWPNKSKSPNTERVFNLSTFEFDNKFAPKAFGFLKNFHQDTGVHFEYESEKLQLTKSIYLFRDTDTVVLQYDFRHLAEPAEFVLRPFVGLRGFHTLQKSYAPLTARRKGDVIIVRQDSSGTCELMLDCPDTRFEKDEQWWFNFVYRNNKERGQDFTEDLWTPGFFRAPLSAPVKICLRAHLTDRFKREHPAKISSETAREVLRTHQRTIITLAPRTQDGELKMLRLAAERFIAKHQTSGKTRTTILAGYPWFADWGRDAFIALPGLTLETARFDEAKSVLTTFAAAVDQGMVPNRFDDNGSTACFNSVDASLWFINASFQYLSAAADSKTFTQELLPTIRWIIDSYQNGTRFGIRADADGLITAGSSETQLTWMDAKYDGVAFTPRGGKPVEVNALWYNALCLLVEFYNGRNIENAEHYRAMAERAAVGFRQLFWNDKCGYLNDCIWPDGKVDSALRPNQIFAVSLPFSALTGEQQRAVVNVVQKNLLTPYGLRTLNAQDKRYKGTYTGPPRQRDEAYHQGTVWPYLIGPFIEAFLKVNKFSRKSKKQAAQFIQPLLNHLTQDACLGSVSEIFDGDAPHKPRGCIAQAWSVAELIRAHQMIHN